MSASNSITIISDSEEAPMTTSQRRVLVLWGPEEFEDAIAAIAEHTMRSKYHAGAAASIKAMVLEQRRIQTALAVPVEKAPPTPRKRPVREILRMQRGERPALEDKSAEGEVTVALDDE